MYFFCAIVPISNLTWRVVANASIEQPLIPAGFRKEIVYMGILVLLSGWPCACADKNSTVNMNELHFSIVESDVLFCWTQRTLVISWAHCYMLQSTFGKRQSKCFSVYQHWQVVKNRLWSSHRGLYCLDVRRYVRRKPHAFIGSFVCRGVMIVSLWSTNSSQGLTLITSCCKSLYRCSE